MHISLTFPTESCGVYYKLAAHCLFLAPTPTRWATPKSACTLAHSDDNAIDRLRGCEAASEVIDQHLFLVFYRSVLHFFWNIYFLFSCHRVTAYAPCAREYVLLKCNSLRLSRYCTLLRTLPSLDLSVLNRKLTDHRRA